MKLIEKYLLMFLVGVSMSLKDEEYTDELIKNGETRKTRSSGDWRAEVDNLMRTYQGGSNEDYVRLLASDLSDHYPDITWVVMVYDDVSGFDKHAIYEQWSYVHYRFRYYGKNFAVGRYTGARVTSTTNLDDRLNEISDDAGNTCKKYCPDPACWFPYHRIDARGAAEKIYNKLNSYYNVRMTLVVQGDHARLYVRRTEGNGDNFSYSRIIVGPAYVLDWDRRVAVTALYESCGTAAALAMAD